MSAKLVSIIVTLASCSEGIGPSWVRVLSVSRIVALPVALGEIIRGVGSDQLRVCIYMYIPVSHTDETLCDEPGPRPVPKAVASLHAMSHPHHQFRRAEVIRKVITYKVANSAGSCYSVS